MRDYTSWLVLVFVCLLAGRQPGLAAAPEIYPSQPGIWLSEMPDRRCTTECQQQLLESLQRITGLAHLEFTRAGELTVCDWADTAAGSASARALLFRALHSGHAYTIEAHPGSPNVTFGQLDAGLIYETADTGQRFTIWRLRLDLADFKRIDAPAAVLASFDVGFAFLHELLHGLGYEDATEADALGPCEELVNQVRVELDLPLRAHYFGSALQVATAVFTIRLDFRDPPLAELSGGKRSKRRTYQLFFAPEMGQGLRILKDINTKSFLRRR
jgi:hypothetical protein